MDLYQSESPSAAQLRELAYALEDLRSALEEMSLALGDLLIDLPSDERDRMRASVRRYLHDLSASSRS